MIPHCPHIRSCVRIRFWDSLYCPHCKKHVEPVVSDAVPKATLGHQVIALTSWFHYGLGLTINQVVDILNYQMQTKLTPGGLVDAWRRLAEVLRAWYEQIGEEAKASAHLHADETGRRVNGQTYRLWCFTNDRNCYYPGFPKSVDCRGMMRTDLSPQNKRFSQLQWSGSGESDG